MLRSELARPSITAIMPHRASYSALNGQSTSRLPIAANDSEDVSDQEHARGADREGLLSGEKNEEEQSPIAGKSKEWLDHVQVCASVLEHRPWRCGGSRRDLRRRLLC